MSESSKKSGAAATAAASDQLEAVAQINGAAMEVFTQACQAYASGLASWNSEVMSFMNKRLQHDADLGRALSKCQNWEQATEAQQDWMRTASAEYLAEASKLMEFASKAAKDNWQPVYDRANQALADLQKTTK